MSTSGGATWTKVNQTLREVFAITVDPLCQAGSFGDYTNIRMAISTSTDDGATWNRSLLGSGEIKALAVDPKNKKIVYAGGVYEVWRDGLGYPCGRLFKSSDGGINWGEIGASVFNREGFPIYAITIDPRNSTKVLVCTGSGVFLSQDGGATWIAPQQTIYCTCIVPDQVVADKYYLGSSIGAWMSIDGGTAWQPINNGLTNLMVQCIAHDTTNKVLYAGTAGAGVFRLFLDVAVGIEKDGRLVPTQFALSQNYPNPFNPATTISFELPTASRVSLRVFNALGQEVAVLVDEEKKPGVYEVRWNTNLPSGIYFYRLQAGDYLKTMKMALVK